MSAHGGFIIPNAEGATAAKMSEPDQVDFVTLGNSRWGVVTGCEVTIAGGSTTASIPPSVGLVVVNGAVVQVPGNQSITLGSGGSQPRYDLICVNDAGILTSVPGTPAVEPVFPDVPANMTLLAAVYCPIGSSNFSSTVIDKRNILQSVFVGNSAASSTLLLNRYSGDDTFRITGAGRLEWNNSDTFLARTSSGLLTLTGSLAITSSLQVQDVASSGNITAVGTLSASNLMRSSSFPTTATQGTILQRQGHVYVQTSAASTAPVWEEVITASGANQPGDIKQSMRTPDQMPGWLPLAGQTVTEPEQPQLFLVGGLQSFIVNDSPRWMQLPDATQRILLPTQSVAGQTGGSAQITLEIDNLPPHLHGVAIQPGGAHGHPASTDQQGAHQHTTTPGSGKHTHPVNDPGHYHAGVDSPNGSDFIAVQWLNPPQHMLDGPVNDSSHGPSVNNVSRTKIAKTGITRTEEGTAHQHATDLQGGHGHTVTVTPATNHTHPISEQAVGGGAAIPVQPPYLTVFTYIKV